MSLDPAHAALGAVLAAAVGPALEPFAVRLDAVHERLDAVTAQNGQLSDEVAKLTTLVTKLADENEKLADENAELKAQNEHLLGQCGAVNQALTELVRAVSAEDADGASSEQLAQVRESLSQAASGALATIQQGSPHAAMQRKGIDPKGVLAHFLKSRDAKLSIAQGKALWTEVFEVDWQGDLAALPVDCFVKKCRFEQSRRPRSRKILEREMALGNKALAALAVDSFEKTGRFEPFWCLRSRSMFDRVKALGNKALAAGLAQAAICNWWLDQLDFSQANNIAAHAAACGSISMLKFVNYGLKANITELALYKAAGWNGQVEALKWLRGAWFKDANGFSKGWLLTVALDCAISTSQFSAVAWLIEDPQTTCTVETMRWAANLGSADIFDCLFMKRYKAASADLVEKAASQGHLNILKRVHAIMPAAITPSVVNEAAASGQTEALHWLVSNTDARPTRAAIDRAVAGGKLRVLPILRSSIPAEFESHPAATALGSSCQDAIAWFGRTDLPSSVSDTLSLAIKESHFAAIAWLITHAAGTNWGAEELESVRALLRKAGWNLPLPSRT